MNVWIETKKGNLVTDKPAFVVYVGNEQGGKATECWMGRKIMNAMRIVNYLNGGKGEPLEVEDATN